MTTLCAGCPADCTCGVNDAVASHAGGASEHLTRELRTNHRARASLHIGSHTACFARKEKSSNPPPRCRLSWWVYDLLPSAPILHRYRNRAVVWGLGQMLIVRSIVATGAGLHVAASFIEQKALSRLPPHC